MWIVQTPAPESAEDCLPSKTTGHAAVGPSATLARALHQYCRDNMAHFKVPRYYIFASEFPLTVTGKIQKFKMVERSIDLLHLRSIPPAHS